MPTPKPEVHIGDRGPRYRLRLINQDGDAIDPTSAIVKELWFDMPQGQLRKAAEVISVGSPATAWDLAYQVVGNDGIGSPAGEVHLSTGRFTIQAHVEWADGVRKSSTIGHVADNGMELRVHRNIVAMDDDNEF